jgi:hypothetical protein
MLPAPPLRQPSLKRPAVQWDMGVLLRHRACAHESMSPQAGISQSAMTYRPTSALWQVSGPSRSHARRVGALVRSLSVPVQMPAQFLDCALA